MNAAYRALAVRRLDEWVACVNARARIVYMLNGRESTRFPRLHTLLRYYNVKTRRLWNDFREAYQQAMARPHLVTG